MEFLSILGTSFAYMVKVPFFWPSMGMTAAISMFIGPLFFNGNLGTSLRALSAKMLFATMMFWLSVSQIIDATQNHPHLLTPGVKAVSYVVALNIVVVTIAWIFGFMLGILIFKNQRK